jgi:AcrR family transcriptional regulator
MSMGTTDRPMSRQQRVGAASREETRARLLVAAGREFEAKGYVATTVSRIAAEAGVTVQTLYLAWGSKRALLRAYLASELTGGTGSPSEVAERFVDESAEDVVARLAGVVSEIASRAAVGWKLYQDTSPSDPEIAADWAELQSLRRNSIAEILERVPDSALRPGLTRDAAVDTAWLITSPESYDLLVRRRHYSPDEFRAWMTQSLTTTLLDPSGR